ncbi:MAG: LysM domain-containing protein [Chloroflexi bacterium]|nr:LysM domain-containing protein [Chloroflexota bacterium]
MRIFWLFALIPGFIIFAGCSSSLDSRQSVLPISLSPYFTRTPFITASLTLPVTQTAVPTLTPMIYTIARNDTLSGIASRYGVVLEALLAANPGIIPESLSVGQTLIIPSASQSAVTALSSTPVPLDLGPSICQPSGNGVICLIPVHNPYPQALENVKVQVTLYDESGQSLASQEAVLPLNLLPPDKVLPAVVFFSTSTAGVSAQAGLVTSMRLEPGDHRYLQTSIQNQLVSINWDGLSANVQGLVLLAETEKPATSIWLAAVAYDIQDQIVGYRRWEWSGALQPGGSQPFILPVYSLGTSIQRVEVFVEARP